MAKTYKRKWPNQLVGFAFGQMERSPALQSADMIAYEAFVHQCMFEKTGENFSHRPNMVKLMNCLAVWAGFYSEESLLDYASQLTG